MITKTDNNDNDTTTNNNANNCNNFQYGYPYKIYKIKPKDTRGVQILIKNCNPRMVKI